MVKVALTVEGDTDEVMECTSKTCARRWFRNTGAECSRYGGASRCAGPKMPRHRSPAPQPDAPEGSWSTEHVQTFWDFLAPQARDIYRRVAGGNGYTLSREALLDGTGLTARVLSGRLSSQGHAVRRIRRFHNVSLPHPMSFDSQTEEYRMLSDVADAILRLSL